MPKIKCIRDVVMEGDEEIKGKIAFTKGRIYNMYSYKLRNLYDIEYVWCAKNDWGERHIIKYKKDNRLDDFFNKHFEYC